MIADTLVSMRHHLKVALLVAVLAALLAGVAGLVLSRDVYDSSLTIQMKLVGEVQPSGEDSNNATELLATAQSLIASPVVLGPAGEKLDPPVSRTDLTRRVVFSLPSRSLLMILSTEGRTPEKTAETVEAIGESFKARVSETPIVSADGRLKLEWQSAETRTELAEPAPGPARTALAALMAGFLMGVAYLLARVLLDQKMRTTHRIASVTDISVVAMVESSPSPEAIAKLAQNLNFIVSPSLGHRVLGIADTSANPTSATVIEGLAEQLRRKGSATAVLDADLRARPLGDGEEGLSLYLSEERLPAAQSPQLLAGPMPPNPVELLCRPGFARIIESYRATQDWTLVNCPPVLPVSDTAIIARHFDALLLLVDAKHDTKSQLAEALATLQTGQAKVAGLILVNARVSPPKTPYESGAAGYISS